MSLVDTVRADSLIARKAKDKLKSELLVTLLSDMVNVGKNKGNTLTTDAEAIAVLKTYIENANNNIKLGNDELKQKSQQELDVLLQYLPVQLTKDELITIINKSLGSIDTSKPSMKLLGVVMNSLKTNYPGRYDTTLVTSITKSILGLN